MPALIVVLAALTTLGSASAPAWRSQPPPTGVYLCLDKSSIAQRMRMFSLVDATTYADDYGKQGRYAYDPARGLLTGVSGPLRGVTYRRDGPQSFRLQGIDGDTTVICPLDPGKDPRGRDW